MNKTLPYHTMWPWLLIFVYAHDEEDLVE